MRTFVISDTHFWHGNILKYENRPFNSLEEMNECLIKNWNSVVSPDDIIIFCGDFCFGDRNKGLEIAKRLNGHKTIILGNHDRNKSFYFEAGFQDVKKQFYLPKEVSGYKYDILFTHQPYIGLPEGCVNIHGHIHGKTLDNNMFDTKKHFNVSVENISYTPIELQTIIQFKGW